MLYDHKTLTNQKICKPVMTGKKMAQQLGIKVKSIKNNKQKYFFYIKTLGIYGDTVVFSLTSYKKHSHRILHYSICIMSLYFVSS